VLDSIYMFVLYAIVDIVIRDKRYTDYSDPQATNGNIYFSVKKKDVKNKINIFVKKCIFSAFYDPRLFHTHNVLLTTHDF
jgi:hypothetical protein